MVCIQVFPGKCHSFVDFLFGDRKVDAALQMSRVLEVEKVNMEFWDIKVRGQVPRDPPPSHPI